MFGTYFYHKRVRSAVSVFGSLFNNLYVLRKNSAGQTISQVKVPLSYAPKRNFIARLESMNNGEEAERRVAIKLPRMSFEITSIAYDETRQLNKMNTLNKVVSGSTTTRQKIFSHYQVNKEILDQAKPDVIFLHCLPAVRGQEISHNLLEDSRSCVWKQAENRLHAQKGLLVELLN